MMTARITYLCWIGWCIGACASGADGTGGSGGPADVAATVPAPSDSSTSGTGDLAQGTSAGGTGGAGGVGGAIPPTGGTPPTLPVGGMTATPPTAGADPVPPTGGTGVLPGPGPDDDAPCVPDCTGGAICHAGWCWDHVIEDLEQTSTLRIDGHANDNTLVRNCRIHDASSDGIFLKNVTNVRIQGCELWNIQGLAAIRASETGSTENVTIVGNYIHNVTQDGIRSAQDYDNGIDHLDWRILDNVLDDIGEGGSQGLYHPLYIQGSDTLIEGNRIGGTIDGNGISIRTSGVIRRNVVGVRSRGGKAGIRYYSDHAKGPSNALVIENNIVFMTEGSSAIDVYEPVTPARTDTYPGNWVVENFVVRFNTAVNLGDGDAFRLQAGSASHPYTYTFVGNLAVRSGGGSIVSKPSSGVTESHNVETTSLGDFVQATAPYDFHLRADAAACSQATGASDFPEDDVDGDPRPGTSGLLSGGADQCP